MTTETPKGSEGLVEKLRVPITSLDLEELVRAIIPDAVIFADDAEHVADLRRRARERLSFLSEAALNPQEPGNER